MLHIVTHAIDLETVGYTNHAMNLHDIDIFGEGELMKNRN